EIVAGIVKVHESDVHPHPRTQRPQELVAASVSTFEISNSKSHTRRRCKIDAIHRSYRRVGGTCFGIGYTHTPYEQKRRRPLDLSAVLFECDVEGSGNGAG